MGFNSGFKGLTSIRQFVHCDLHLRSAASLIQNRAGFLGVRIGIYANGRPLVMAHCNGPHFWAVLHKLLYPTQLFISTEVLYRPYGP